MDRVQRQKCGRLLSIASAPTSGPVRRQPHLVLGTKRLSRDSPARQPGSPARIARWGGSGAPSPATRRLRSGSVRGSAASGPRSRNSLGAALPPCRCWTAAAVWSGATRCEAGKSARRFLATSSGRVIRIRPKQPPAHQCAGHVSPSASLTRRGTERQRAYEPRRFSGPRKPAADGQCRRGVHGSEESFH